MKITNTTGMVFHSRFQTTHPDGPGLTFILKGTFTAVPGGAAVLAPEQRKMSGDQRYMDEIGRSLAWSSDMVAHKPHTDFVVIGSFFQPNGIPRSEGRAGLWFGPLHKEVRIRGPRHAIKRSDGTWLVTAPQPITSLPLRWEYSAGSLNDRRNPFGLGQDYEVNGSGIKLVRLPQIEDPGRPHDTPDDRHPPVNVAPVPPQFLERSRKLGTRDRRWATFRAPLPPRDYDPSYTNAAPAGQMAGNRPRGDEVITLTNMHPAHPHLLIGLPGLRASLAVLRVKGVATSASMVAMALDTVVVLPGDEELVLLWRGHLRVDAAARDTVAEIAVETVALDSPPAVPSLADRLLAGFRQVPTPDQVDADLAAKAAARLAKAKDSAAADQAAMLANVRSLAKDAQLPDSIKHTIATENDPEKLLAQLYGHIDDVVAQIQQRHPSLGGVDKADP